MQTPLPHRYSVDLVAGPTDPATLAVGGRTLAGGPPPQFGGQDTWWSPEDLLLASAELCLLTTFRSLAARQHVTVCAYRSRAEGILDKTSEGPRFTSIVLHVEVEVDAAMVARVQQILSAAKRMCIVTHALKPEVQLHATVRVAARSCAPAA